ncbi:MAG: hypothetical protein Q8N99_05805 [Nanoarchaeota archaeon]|nr:hypothetical protein [Nanoarchaeota archaeon]
MITKKDRRHSGRKTICSQDNGYPYQETKWDNWSDYRDGFRGSKDKTLIRKRGIGYGSSFGKNLDSKIKRNNLKLKKYYKIRMARKEKSKIKYGPRRIGLWTARCKRIDQEGNLL